MTIHRKQLAVADLWQRKAFLQCDYITDEMMYAISAQLLSKLGGDMGREDQARCFSAGR